MMGERSRRSRSASAGHLALGFGLLGIVGASTLVRLDGMTHREESRRRLEHAVPIEDMTGDGFVGSGACRSCHPAQHASWRVSFHRTMTQRALPGNVVGDFDDVSLTLPARELGEAGRHHAREFRLERRGDEFWVRMADPDWEARLRSAGVHPDSVEVPPVVWRRVVMTTGSHLQQTCWVEGESPGRPHNLPFMWLIEDRRWVPRDDVFMAPPGARRFSTWNDNCIQCHSVGGWWNLDPRTRSSERVAELGIACEACHGPALEHCRANRDPARRYRGHRTGDPDPTIRNPARLPAPASSQVCGQCHGILQFVGSAFLAGERYAPGDELNDTHRVVRGSAPGQGILEDGPHFLEERFWPDGMVRVSGREYNAMIESACFEGGELSCLACHSMHGYESADHQMRPGMASDEACFACHADYRERVAEHTHHDPASAGSACYDCHMPHTVWGLLKAMRSHWIDSPRVGDSLAAGRPNACNLCHLDRTLGWTARRLEEWYGQSAPELTRDQDEIASGILWLLGGDANQRGLVAWHMGWERAQRASGTDWMAPFLANALLDPYAAVRHAGIRSLRTLAGFEDFEYDYVAPLEREQAVRAIARDWRFEPGPGQDGSSARLLIGDDGRLRVPSLLRLIRARDERRVVLAE